MSRRRAILALAAAAAGLALAGCGFTPLYAARPGIAPALASIEVVAPSGRAGALMREHLDDAFGRNVGATPTYRMNLSIGETRYPRGVRIDNTATRYEYVLTAQYNLTAAATGRSLKIGEAKVTLTYDSADKPYASIMGQQDAQDRATEEAARRIQLELAAWMAEQPSS